MLDALFNSVLPVFAIVGIAIGLARAGVFDVSVAQVVNKYLFHIGLPVLMFGLLARSDITGYDWALLGGYFGIEATVYLAAFLIFRFWFKRPAAEAVILGMGAFFANHLMYVLPIAIAEYGEPIGLKIITLVTLDAVVFYIGSMILLEILTGQENGAGAAAIARKIASNPQIVAVVLGLIASAIRLPMANGIGVFATFVGNSAAPLSLFALGLIVSEQRIGGRQAVPWALVGFNIVAMPAIGYLVFVVGLGFDIARAAPAVLVMAGPVGLMAFVLALQYRQPTGEIARAVLISTVLSVITVAIALQIV